MEFTVPPLTSHWTRRLAALLVSIVVVAPLRGQAKDITLFSRYRALASTMEQVDRLVTTRQFDQAREKMTACLAKIPDHYEAHYYLAVMAYESRDYASALANIEQSKQSLTDLDRLYSSELAAIIAPLEQTAALLENTLIMDDRGAGSNNCQEGYIASLKVSLAKVQRKRGTLEGSETPFAIPKAYHLLHGNSLFRLGRNSEAEAQYRVALQVDPTYGLAWNNLVNCLWMDRNYTSALDCLRKAEATGVAITPDLRKVVLAAVK